MEQILEDLTLVNHVRDSFFALQDSLVGCTPSLMHCTMDSSSCLVSLSHLHPTTHTNGSFDIKSLHEVSYDALSLCSQIYLQDVQVLGIFMIA